MKPLLLLDNNSFNINIQTNVTVSGKLQRDLSTTSGKINIFLAQLLSLAFLFFFLSETASGQAEPTSCAER